MTSPRSVGAGSAVLLLFFPTLYLHCYTQFYILYNTMCWKSPVQLYAYQNFGSTPNINVMGVGKTRRTYSTISTISYFYQKDGILHETSFGLRVLSLHASVCPWVNHLFTVQLYQSYFYSILLLINELSHIVTRTINYLYMEFLVHLLCNTATGETTINIILAP